MVACNCAAESWCPEPTEPSRIAVGEGWYVVHTKIAPWGGELPDHGVSAAPRDRQRTFHSWRVPRRILAHAVSELHNKQPHGQNCATSSLKRKKSLRLAADTWDGVIRGHKRGLLVCKLGCQEIRHQQPGTKFSSSSTLLGGGAQPDVAATSLEEPFYCLLRCCGLKTRRFTMSAFRCR